MKPSRKVELIDLVRSFLKGDLKAAELIDHLPKGPSLSREEEKLLHEINHFIADADIHVKDGTDTSYRELQLEQIRDLLERFEKAE